MKPSKSARKSATKSARKSAAPKQKDINRKRPSHNLDPGSKVHGSRRLTPLLLDADPSASNCVLLDGAYYSVVHGPVTTGKAVEFDPSPQGRPWITVTTAEISQEQLMRELIELPIQAECKDLSPKRRSALGDSIVGMLLAAGVVPPGFPCPFAKEILDRLDGLNLPR